MNTSKRYAPEVRQRAVHMVFDHEADYPSQWATIDAIGPKIGCTLETLRHWVRQAERDAGRREGTTTSERERIKAQIVRDCRRRPPQPVDDLQASTHRRTSRSPAVSKAPSRSRKREANSLHSSSSGRY